MTPFRYRLFQIFIGLSFLAIVVRLFQFQILEYSKHKAAVERNAKNTDIEMIRSDIQDRYGKMLSINLNKYILEFYPQNQLSFDRDKLFKSLNEIFGFNKPELLKSNHTEILSREINKEQAEKIRKLNASELYLRKRTTRVYPQGKMASNLLGYVDLYGEAKEGIEKYFEESLLADPSSSLELSLDGRLQVFVEDSLNQQILATEAERGTLICMKVKTGEILAWGISPNYDPNKYYEYPVSTLKNWSIVDTYQPGSIFKIITVASAIDSGSITKDVKFLDRGFIEVDKWKITNHDYETGKTQAAELDLVGLFARSSNPFAAYLALNTGAETFYNYIQVFGFGEKTGIELPGESKGILKRSKYWKKSDIASTALGHGAISVTPIQMIAAVNAVANKGLWIKPTLIKRFDDRANPVENLKSYSGSSVQVLKPESAKFIIDSLAKSIEKNLQENKSLAGKVEGLRVAGKTGTSEKIKEGGAYYSHKNTIASFVGIFPAEDPEYIVLTVIDDPQKEGGWGSTVAAPVFNKVASFMKNLYGL
jgi:cell division protein FtsI/penicillin-binding protein 2